ncbi:nucleotidyltransferase domain-containing protein [Planotetraspora kaengkrachanensis]|uniref:Nucleotidyltransferase n=1 Tax=Planotetraspora kaengkrachanensis TaxID=575193 RepID=A0A8J3PY74_9ACTN|nr:nucleotidyltransferase domain-containing protein [Planotetraspora kaengkrachanensis]GIG83076.1 nucleotidyltransferase [Planotetraspora kaengkrachanensis]
MDGVALGELAQRLVEIPGVVAVVLGGSRARGTHRPDSDIDLGLYYRGDLDVAALRALAVRETGEQAGVTEPGGWGPWVDGGGWLTIGDWRVDWIYRDLDRVHRVWDGCREGRYDGVQAGHPLGFYSHAYAGEVALCRVLADPSGELTDLRESTQAYPAALGAALVDGLWEADFSVGLARYGAAGVDPAYAAGCLFRAVGVACQALHGHAGRWLINEKGMVASAGRLPMAPQDFAARAQRLLGHVGESTQQIEQTVADAAALVRDVRAVVSRDGMVTGSDDGSTPA